MTNDKSVLWFVDDGDCLQVHGTSSSKAGWEQCQKGPKGRVFIEKKTVNWTELTNQLSIHKDSQSHQQKTEL